MSKKKVYWAGFIDNKLHTSPVSGRLSIWISKRKAQFYGNDVRPVRIVEVK